MSARLRLDSVQVLLPGSSLFPLNGCIPSSSKLRVNTGQAICRHARHEWPHYRARSIMFINKALAYGADGPRRDETEHAHSTGACARKCTGTRTAQKGHSAARRAMNNMECTAGLLQACKARSDEKHNGGDWLKKQNVLIKNRPAALQPRPARQQASYGGDAGPAAYLHVHCSGSPAGCEASPCPATAVASLSPDVVRPACCWLRAPSPPELGAGTATAAGGCAA